MIYHVMIKNSGNLDCKYIFNSMGDIKDFFKLIFKKQISKTTCVIGAESVTEVIKGANLLEHLEENTFITKIDESVCTKWADLFKGILYNNFKG